MNRTLTGLKQSTWLLFREEAGLIEATTDHFHSDSRLNLPVVAPHFLSVQEVLLGDGDVVRRQLLRLVLADGDDGVAHLQRPPVHHAADVDVPPLGTHGLHTAAINQSINQSVN